MKKILIIIICILSFVVLMYSENTEKVIPLVQSETLEYFYNQNNDVLTIYKIDGQNKQIYFENKEALWGGYQISKDKKSLIFWKDTFEQNMPLYYLDGNKGQIKFIGDISLNARLDESGKYLLYEELYNSGVFTLINLENKKVETKMKWTLNNKNKWTEIGGVFNILRAADNDKYDYLILFEIENHSIAKAYIDIKTTRIFTVYDDSNRNEIELKTSADYQSDFTGWY